jgi:hypothetical protein
MEELEWKYVYSMKRSNMHGKQVRDLEKSCAPVARRQCMRGGRAVHHDMLCSNVLIAICIECSRPAGIGRASATEHRCMQAAPRHEGAMTPM